MANYQLPANINKVQESTINYILRQCPNANMDKNIDYTVVDIVLHMDNLTSLQKVVNWFNQGFEENEIISIVNQPNERIEIMYDLINKGVERGNATAVICLSDEDLDICLSFINDYHINNDDLSTILYNKFDKMFPRMKHLIERGITHFEIAYTMAEENNDTEDNINKMMELISSGMYSRDAYGTLF